jgi:hypothetical protein
MIDVWRITSWVFKNCGVLLPVHPCEGRATIALASTETSQVYIEAEITRIVLLAKLQLQTALAAAVERVSLHVRTPLANETLQLCPQTYELSYIMAIIGILPGCQLQGPCPFVPETKIQTAIAPSRRTLPDGAPSPAWRSGAQRQSSMAFLAGLEELRRTDPEVKEFEQLRRLCARALPPCMYMIIHQAGMGNDRLSDPNQRFKIDRKLFLMSFFRNLGMDVATATWFLEVLLRRSKGGRDGGDNFGSKWQKPLDASKAWGCQKVSEKLHACPWQDAGTGPQVLRDYANDGALCDIEDADQLLGLANDAEGRYAVRMCGALQDKSVVLTDEPPDPSRMCPMRWTHRSQ